MREKTVRIGQRFGRLVVTEWVHNKNGLGIWACDCDCGNKTYATTGHLNAGEVKSCGCIRREQKNDLVGRRFGKLVVIGKSQERRPNNRSILWECQCDCGNVCLKPTRELNAGSATSCGCAWRASSIHPGERYGRLVTVQATDKRQGRAVVWLCRCDCGNMAEVQAGALKSGHVSSCGCLKSELDREKPLKNLTYVDDTCIEFLRHIDVPTSVNTTGVRGITKTKSGKYQATITFQKKRHYLGTFATLEEATEARRSGERMVEDFLKEYDETCVKAR